MRACRLALKVLACELVFSQGLHCNTRYQNNEDSQERMKERDARNQFSVEDIHEQLSSTTGVTVAGQ
jgi:hypothetical protein